MKAPKLFLRILLAIIVALTGCSHAQQPGLANELRFSLTGVSNVTISYDEEPVSFYPAEGDELIIKEYMTENKRSYYAQVSQSGSGIQISEGGKPLFHDNFSRRVEVFLPASYREALNVTTTDGTIACKTTALQLSELRIDTTAGTVDLDRAAAASIHLSTTSGRLNLGTLEADKIRLDTTSGTLTCDTLRGQVEYSSTSGDAIIKSAVGSGRYQAANSGNLDVTYTTVNGDLYFFNKNGSITLQLPKELSFSLEATTKNGSITTPLQDALSSDGRTTRGVVGSDPTVSIQAETNNGTITITQ